MIHQEKYDNLCDWQRAVVDREVDNVCADHPAYRFLDNLRDGSDAAVADAADTVIGHIRDEAFDEVLTDPDFMESITTDEETRYMTKENSRAY